MSEHAGHKLWHIILLSLAMFTGCFVAGMIPLATSLSQRKIQMFSLFGAGLLVGVALAVIIPEGVQSLYDISASEDEDGGDGHNHTDHSSTIGISLILGFALMLLIDNLGGGHSHSHGGNANNNEEKSLLEGKQQVVSRGSGGTITVGLIVHAAADGIALGAASATERTDLQAIVFVAIMLHKAPAAFGLTSVLLKERISNDRIRCNLLIFALAAPVGAILTISFFLVSDSINSSSGPAVAMLFSAGTFLYVATVHVLPEVTEGKKLEAFNIFLVITGLILPLVLGEITHAFGGHGH